MRHETRISGPAARVQKRLLFAATLSFLAAIEPASAAGLFENSDWNFTSANTSATANQISLETLRQQKNAGGYNYSTTQNIQVQTENVTNQNQGQTVYTSNSVGNMNSVSVTANHGAAVGVTTGQSNTGSSQGASINTGGNNSQSNILNGTLKNVMSSN
jgi:hypothetical protein